MLPNIWLLFQYNLDIKNFQKSPNLVTLFPEKECQIATLFNQRPLYTRTDFQ